MRYFFEISYKGTNYHGWQRQANANTIQEEVESRLGKIFGREIEITASGRTDTGVHCEQQYFHIDVDRPLTEDDRWKINSFLPDDILIRSIMHVPPGAHARFDALYRRYNYFIINQKEPFLKETAAIFHKELNVDAMNSASAILLGKKDFECFSKVKTDVKTFVCDIQHAKWERKDELLIFDIGADRFLRGMVRAIVGTLLEVGEGKRTVEGVRELLESRDRKLAGAAAAPHGLTLKEVRYPKNYFN